MWDTLVKAFIFYLHFKYMVLWYVVCFLSDETHVVTFYHSYVQWGGYNPFLLLIIFPPYHGLSAVWFFCSSLCFFVVRIDLICIFLHFMFLMIFFGLFYNLFLQVRCLSDHSQMQILTNHQHRFNDWLGLFSCSTGRFGFYLFIFSNILNPQLSILLWLYSFCILFSFQVFCIY